ncbi:MAG: hypothetical protein M1438_16695 [Deltaproteobacteria bacterium]|nr:hypothetical protein [Deltaproteobacteria bacterium]
MSNSLYPLKGKRCLIDILSSKNNSVDNLLKNHDNLNYFKNQLATNLQQCGLTIIHDPNEDFDINVIIDSVILKKERHTVKGVLLGGSIGCNFANLSSRIIEWYFVILFGLIVGGLLGSRFEFFDMKTIGKLLIKNTGEDFISHKTVLGFSARNKIGLKIALKKAAETISYRINEKLLSVYR